MRIQSSLGKGKYVEKRNIEAEEARMKSYNDRFMRLLKKAEAEVDENGKGKEGSR